MADENDRSTGSASLSFDAEAGEAAPEPRRPEGDQEQESDPTAAGRRPGAPKPGGTPEPGDGLKPERVQ